MTTQLPSAHQTSMGFNPQSIETNLVNELRSLCRSLREVMAPDTGTRSATRVPELVAEIDAFSRRWGNPALGLEQVVQAVRQQRDKVVALCTLHTTPAELQKHTEMLYYTLENIPSQVSAAFEQQRIEQGTAPSRYQLLNEIARLRGSRSYLEIGCCSNACFDSIQCSQKVGVDPQSGGTLRMTSDAFFAVNQQHFDLIFIDGLHESWQVDKDIANALRWSSPDGVIVLHDCNPVFEVRAVVPQIAETWNGDVWKSFVRVRSRADLDCATGLFDHGCGVICKRPNTVPIESLPEEALTWDRLESNRARWLRTLPYDELLGWIGK